MRNTLIALAVAGGLGFAAPALADPAAPEAGAEDAPAAPEVEKATEEAAAEPEAGAAPDVSKPDAPAADPEATDEPADGEAPAVVKPEGETTEEPAAEEPEEPAPVVTKPEPAGVPTITDPSAVIAGRAVTSPNAHGTEGETIARPNKPLLGAAAGLAVAGAITYGVALGARNELFGTNERPYEDFDKLKSRANTFSVIGAGLGAAALGTGIGAFIVGDF